MENKMNLAEAARRIGAAYHRVWHVTRYAKRVPVKRIGGTVYIKEKYLPLLKWELGMRVSKPIIPEDNIEVVPQIVKPSLKVIGNTLVYSILEQVEEVRNNSAKSKGFTSSEGVKIVSYDYPTLTYSDLVYIRGGNKDADKMVCNLVFDSRKEATDYKNKIERAFKEFNKAGGFVKPEKEVEKVETPLIKPVIKVLNSSIVYCIEEQDESLRGNKDYPRRYKASNGVTITSIGGPDISKLTTQAYIRGHVTTSDFDIITCKFKTKTEALKFKEKLEEAFQEFNEAGGFTEELPIFKTHLLKENITYIAIGKHGYPIAFSCDTPPKVENDMWTEEKDTTKMTILGLKDSFFEELRNKDWRKSLHKVEHIH